MIPRVSFDGQHAVYIGIKVPRGQYLNSRLMTIKKIFPTFKTNSARIEWQKLCMMPQIMLIAPFSEVETFFN